MLKELRIEKKLTQKEVADLVGISLRSYKSYENDETKRNTIKYNYILEKLKSINPIDEEHGILDLEDIEGICSDIFEKYPIEYVYLFGSYAKGLAKEDSDIDLLISSDLKGLKYFGMIEELRNGLKKKIDALNLSQLKDNLELTKEILKDGIKIYG
ncbi:MAG: nucleotidyltransferase domain-containing protein [Lachnospiraceae bacterium]|nr:nucleotidyltransferase domain-containing protein [Lachnospiraceae bacterium]